MSAPPTLRSPLPTRLLLLAGLLPLPWFLVFGSIAGALDPGYSAAAQHVSELTVKPGLSHVLVNVAALGSGLAFVLFAIGLWIEAGRTVSFGAICWAVFGVSMLSNGVWPMGSPLHGLYAVGLLNLVAPTLSLLELRGLRDRAVPFAVTVFVSLAGIAYLWLNLTGNDPEGYRGLTQRIFSSINALWPAVVAVYLLRARGTRGSRLDVLRQEEQKIAFAPST